MEEPTDTGDHAARVERGTARQRLLDAAEDLFAEHGIAATSTRAIAERAGTSAGAFFYHFPSKEALVMAVLTEKRPHDHMVEILTRHDDPAEALRAVAVDILEMVDSQRGTLLLVIRGEGPVPQDLLEERLSGAISSLTEYLHKRLPDISIEDASTLAETFLQSIILAEVLLPSQDPHTRADRIIGVLLHGWI